MPKNRKIVKPSLTRRLQRPSSSLKSPRSIKRKSVKKAYKRPLQRPLAIKRTFSHYKELLVRSPHFHKLELLMRALFVIGSLLVIIYFALRINQGIQLAFFTPQVTPIASRTEKTYAIPARLTISKVGIDLAIDEEAVSNTAWQISDKGASHLNISARPGEKGPIILYGHNTNDRFGPIRWLNKGDVIAITTTDGKKHTYRIGQTMKVKPDRIDIFTKEKGESLILYTCDGFADLERFVIIAQPSK